jgi:hypothetical protein
MEAEISIAKLKKYKSPGTEQYLPLLYLFLGVFGTVTLVQNRPSFCPIRMSSEATTGRIAVNGTVHW